MGSEDEDSSATNHDEIPVVRISGSSSDSSEDVPPTRIMDTNDPYAEIPVFSEPEIYPEMEAKSIKVYEDEVAAVLQSSPERYTSSLATDQALVSALENVVGEGPGIKGDSAATNYFIGTDIYGVEGMEMELDEDYSYSVEGSPSVSEDYSYSVEEDDIHDELPVTDPDEEEE